MVRRSSSNFTDVVAGTALILAGSTALVGRLGVFRFSDIPALGFVQQWWPLLLIVLGGLLWTAEQENRKKTRAAAQSSEPREVTYGK